VISREQRSGVAEPWQHADFIGKITELQRTASETGGRCAGAGA
jgi:hypothetical protein